MKWITNAISDYVANRRQRQISRLGAITVGEAEKWVEEERLAWKETLLRKDEKINRLQKQCDDAINSARADRDQKVAAANTDLRDLQKRMQETNKLVVGLLEQIRAQIELGQQPKTVAAQSTMPTLSSVMNSKSPQVIIR